MITRKSHGAPSTNTPGNIGDYYIDIDTGKVYQCVDVETEGKDLGFLTVYANDGEKNTAYRWLLVDGVPADWNQNDPTAPDYVKGRTHYEVVETISEPLNITWDGNTDGLVSVVINIDDATSFAFYKISDLVLTDDQIKMITGTASPAEKSVVIADMWEQSVVTEDFVAVGGEIPMLAFVRNDNVGNGLMTFPETGIYAARVADGDTTLMWISSLTTTEPIERTKTVVHKLDRSYLPFDTTERQISEEVIMLNSVKAYTGAFTDIKPESPVHLKEGDVVSVNVFRSDGELNTTGTVGPLTSFSSGDGHKIILENDVVTDTISVGYIYYYPNNGGTFRLKFNGENNNQVIVTITAKIIKDVYAIIDKKHLPDDIGGGVFKVNASYDETNSKWVCDKTYDEIHAAEEAKTPIVGTFTNQDGLVFTLIGCDADLANCNLAAFNVSTASEPKIYKVKVYESEVNVYELALTATSTELT